MKWLAGFVFLAALASTASAGDSPIEQGSSIVSGQVTYSYQGGRLYQDDGQLSFAPGYSYFVSDGCAVGLLLDIESSTGASYTIVSVGPLLSFYLNPERSRTKVKGAVFPVIRTFITRTSWNRGGDHGLWSFGGQFGLDCMLSNTVALQPAV